jgi:hypothetical protein
VRLILRSSDLGAPIFGPIDLDVRYPAFFQALEGERAEVLIYRVARAIVLIEKGLEILPWGANKLSE